jgi:hypothetical protein
MKMMMMIYNMFNIANKKSFLIWQDGDPVIPCDSQARLRKRHRETGHRLGYVNCTGSERTFKHEYFL